MQGVHVSMTYLDVNDLVKDLGSKPKPTLDYRVKRSYTGTIRIT